jgi:hypothetical protein
VVVLESGFREGDIRLDGFPRANATPYSPDVIINFESKYGPLRYGCNSFWTYQSNVRAIALGLEALRKVDRYGITRKGEQYKGWLALESGMRKSDAETFVRSFVRSDIVVDLPTAYRLAAKQVHPDAGGTREDWDRLQRAKEALSL